MVKHITEQQDKVLQLILEGMDINDIALRLGTTPQNIGQIRQRIYKKGLLSLANKNAFKKGGVVTLESRKARWRWERLHFLIKPYHFEPRYHRIRKDKGNTGIEYGEWLIHLHEDEVEVVLKKGGQFYSENKWEALEKGRLSFNKYLTFAGNEYGFHVVKERKANIRIVDQHLACEGSGVAKGRRSDTHVTIRGIHDNKIFFVFDRSRGPQEHEYTHSDLAISDSDKFEPFFNSIRYHRHYLPHEMTQMLDTMLGVQKAYAENIEKHLVVMDKMSNSLDEQNKIIKKQNTMLNRLNKTISAKKVSAQRPDYIL
jgi:hypothetical protein